MSTMHRNVTQKFIAERLVDGGLEPGQEIGIRIDHSLTQDATRTMVMLELEAIGIERVATEMSARYVDHDLVQQDFKNPDEHLFLRSAPLRSHRPAMSSHVGPTSTGSFDTL